MSSYLLNLAPSLLRRVVVVDVPRGVGHGDPPERGEEEEVDVEEDEGGAEPVHHEEYQVDDAGRLHPTLQRYREGREHHPQQAERLGRHPKHAGGL